MSTVSPRQFVWAVALLFAMAGVLLRVNFRPKAVQPALPDLKTVAAAVISCHNSIRSMEGRFESRMTPTPKLPGQAVKAVAEEHRDSRSSVAFRANIVHGWTHLDETRSFVCPGLSETQPIVVRTTRSFDGQKPCVLHKTLAESPVPAHVPPDVPHTLDCTGSDPTEFTYGPWYFAGLRLLRSPRESLASLFQRNLVTIDGEQSVDGVKCLVISVDADARAGELRMWLDPVHDYLPRKQIHCTPGRDADLERTLIVKEFQQYDDGSGNLRWFPKEAVIQTGFGDYLVDLAELRLNVDCRKEQFATDPETLPPGVRVHDASGSWVTGGRVDLCSELAKLRAEQDRIMEERLRNNRSPGATAGSQEDADSKGLKP